MNLYDVTDQVIKKLIPFHDKKWLGDAADSEQLAKGYSWAELVASQPQPPDFMVSHWWGGRFNDFMTAVDKLVRDKSSSICASLWVCTFANNQFGENFGCRILETPFVKAVENAEATVLIVDRDAGSLARSWCCLELHCTILREKELLLYTSQGMVGSADVSSGPVVDAISQWDVRKSQAAEHAYKRQILNFIAEVPEKSGLMTTDGTLRGDLVLVDGRPQLDPSQVVTEQQLVCQYSDAMEALNMDIRVSVLRSIGPCKRTAGCRIPTRRHRGITLGQLRRFARKAKLAMAKELPEVEWGEIHVSAVLERFIKKVTLKQQCSYVELVAHGPQIPSIYVDFHYSMAFADIMSSIEWFAEAMMLRDCVVLFFSPLGINHHAAEEDIRQLVCDGQKLQVDTAQSECHSLLMTTGARCTTKTEAGISKAPFSISVAWRLYTLECSARLGQDVYIACNSGVMACTKPFPSGHSKFGSMDTQITGAMFQVDVESAECNSDVCRQAIIAFINDGCGLKRLQRRLQRWAGNHLVLCASSCRQSLKGRSFLDEFCSVPGFSIHSELARGNLGQTCLHAAVSADSILVAEKLLAHGFPPNATDVMQETPLHYAALAGNTGMVKWLLSARADPQMESKYGETPLDIAKQNVAAFLGKDSTACAAALIEWEGTRREPLEEEMLP